MSKEEFTTSELNAVKKKLKKSLQDISNSNMQLDEMKKLTEENYSDPFDRATMESDRNLDIRIKERENKLATKIEKAIERIENGTYQVCKICGETIPKSRLLARSVTDLCISCKESQEQGERLS